jgi:hypothetical protein
MTEDSLSVSTVNRGVEEPGRYGAANLFDGDPDTVYCSAAGRGAARIRIVLTDGDEALLPGLTGVRVTPSPSSAARRVETIFYCRSPAGFVTRNADGTIGSAPVTLAIAKERPGSGGPEIAVYLQGDDPRRRHGPLCLADIAFVGPGGIVEMAGLSRALETVRNRDAVLARLAADRAAFARAYLTSFTWSLLNPHKETSDWESADYRFSADGSYQREIYHLFLPERTKGRWSVGGDDSRVLLDGSATKLAPCPSRPGYLCLLGGRIFPDASW